jgi:hypothetical protein
MIKIDEIINDLNDYIHNTTEPRKIASYALKIVLELNDINKSENSNLYLSYINSLGIILAGDMFSDTKVGLKIHDFLNQEEQIYKK